MFLLIKPSILIEWCRIFCASKRNYFYWTSTVLITINILWYIAVILLANLECFPREKIWDKTILEGRCLDPIQVKFIWVYNAAVNLALDIVILVLPQKVIWNLKLNRKKRVGLSMIFAFGFVYVSSPFANSHASLWSDSLADTDLSLALSSAPPCACTRPLPSSTPRT